MRVDLRPFLGTSVTVTVDRPIGSRHPDFADLLYPINYGYLADTVAADGDPIDAYIVGVSKPIAAMHGVVVGLVLRADDNEDKLVVAPTGRRFSIAEIEQMVTFQEQFFDSHVVVADLAQ
jgi:inorganic pyrophosphatase